MKYLKNILTGGVFSEHGCIHVMLAIFPFLNASIFFFYIITKLTLKIFLNIFYDYQDDTILLQNIWKIQASIKMKTQIT